VYIVKPDGGARGQGIYLALSLDDIEEASEGFSLEDGAVDAGGDVGGGGDDDDDDDGEIQPSSPTARRPVMVQAYLPRPLLMDGRKFDLRIYILVTSVYPTLRVFIYKQGLVRFATVKYEAPSESNVGQRRMFLTNYAVNKPGDRPRSPKPWDQPEVVAAGAVGAAGLDGVVSGVSSREAASPAHSIGRSGLPLLSATKGKDPLPTMVLYDPPPGDDSDEGDDEGEEDGALEIEGVVNAAQDSADWDGGPRVASSMKGWEAPGSHHRSPLPPREGKVEIVRAQAGCKWTLSALFECLESQGVDTEVLWERIKDCIFKTILSIRASLASKYRAARPTIRREPPPQHVLEKEAAAVRAKEALKRAALKADRARHMEAAEARAAAKAKAEAEARALAEEREASVGEGLGVNVAAQLPLPSLRYAREDYNSDMLKVLIGPGVLAGLGNFSKPPISQTPSVGFSKRGLLEQPPSTSLSAANSGTSSGGGGSFDLSVTGRKMNLTATSLLPPSSITPGSLPTRSRRNFTACAPTPPENAPLPPELGATPHTRLHVAGSAASLARSLSRTSSVRSVSSGSEGEGGGLGRKNGPGLTQGGQLTHSAIASKESQSSSQFGGAGVNSLPQESREAAAAAAALAAAAAAVSATGLEEEDGEQGFRAFEFMGLDVILDMSHCTCIPQLVGYDPQMVQAAKGGGEWTTAEKREAAGLGPKRPPHRCQPRPVLLEINQSCSMHTDSDLDRIVKGDAMRDGLNMVAPDEKWLLETFVGAIKEVGGLGGAAAAATTVAAGSSTPASSKSNSVGTPPPLPVLSNTPPWSTLPLPPLHCDSLLFSTVATARAALEDPSKDPRLTRITQTCTPLDTRASLNDFPDLHAQVVAGSLKALEESSTLLALWPRGFPSPPNTTLSASSSLANIGSSGGGGAAAAGNTLAGHVRVGSMGGSYGVEDNNNNNKDVTSGPSLLASIRSSDTVPWLPPSLHPLFALQSSVWSEEFWFGVKHHEIFNAAALNKSPKALMAIINSSLAPVVGSHPSVPGGESGYSSQRYASQQAALSGKTASPSLRPPSSSGGVGSEKETFITPLSSLPPLSPRAALVLLLRRLFEYRHSGGFERVSPPTNPALAARYKSIAEFVPPSLRETAAYTKRRADALALRASSSSVGDKGLRK